jgi:GNAT superfamily N-acetyltransferase
MALTRRMDTEELSLILEWAADEGWNPGLDDAAAFYATDPEGFFVTVMDQRPVAAISVVNLDERHAFLGLYLCRPEWRGRGIGYALWKEAILHAGNRVIGLDGVAAQQANYERSGFVLEGATTRYAGQLRGNSSAHIRCVDQTDLRLLTDLDHAANGLRRSAFLASWLCDTDNRKTLVLDSGRGAEDFITIRRCREGAKIGPLIAPDRDAAMMLANAAIAALPSPTVMIDLPATRSDFAEVLIKLGFTAGFTTARMYRGKAPTTTSSLWAIGTMELG